MTKFEICPLKSIETFTHIKGQAVYTSQWTSRHAHSQLLITKALWNIHAQNTHKSRQTPTYPSFWTTLWRISHEIHESQPNS